MCGNHVETKAETFIASGSDGFVPVGSCGVVFSRDRRVQGAIEFYVGGVLIIGRDEVDTIDALWSLMITYLEHFMAGESGLLYFPERKFTLGLRRVRVGNVMVEFVGREGKRTASGRERDVVGELAAGAVEFFREVLNSSPRDEWSYRRDLAVAVRLHEECSSVE